MRVLNHSTVTLVPKTRKAENKIAEGLGTKVVIIGVRNGNRTNYSQFSEADSNSLILVAPLNDHSFNSKYIRWIRLENDPDFTVVI